MYPKVHEMVVNDNYIRLEPFSAGEVSGDSDYKVEEVIKGPQQSQLEDGEFDYLNALRLLGI